MFRFSFTLSEEDAQNFLDILQNAYTNILEERLVALSENNIALAEWLVGHAEYVSKLKHTIRLGMTKLDI